MINIFEIITIYNSYYPWQLYNTVRFLANRMYPLEQAIPQVMPVRIPDKKKYSPDGQPPGLSARARATLPVAYLKRHQKS